MRILISNYSFFLSFFPKQFTVRVLQAMIAVAAPSALSSPPCPGPVQVCVSCLAALWIFSSSLVQALRLCVLLQALSRSMLGCAGRLCALTSLPCLGLLQALSGCRGCSLRLVRAALLVGPLITALSRPFLCSGVLFSFLHRLVRVGVLVANVAMQRFACDRGFRQHCNQRELTQHYPETAWVYASIFNSFSLPRSCWVILRMPLCNIFRLPLHPHLSRARLVSTQHCIHQMCHQIGKSLSTHRFASIRLLTGP